MNLNGTEQPDPEAEAEGEPQFETTPEEATGFGGGGESAPRLNRRKTLAVLSIAVVAAVIGGLLLNLGSPKKKAARADAEASPGRAPSDFLNSLARSGASRSREAAPEGAGAESMEPDFGPSIPADLPAPGSPSAGISARAPAAPQAQAGPAPPQAQSRANTPATDPYRSSLVPRAIEGSLFSGGAATDTRGQASAAAARPAYASGQDAADDYLRSSAALREAAASSIPGYAAAASPVPRAAAAAAAGNGASDPYLQQNAQGNKQAFYDSGAGGGSLGSGRFLGENAIWIGTVIPGILETAINTDLPGNVLARVTQNIYDSQTGRRLLIPQGTILVAKYNSSVSYAQRRVQIVWDTLIRPDGFQLELEGMNSVDRAGMSGQGAQYHENWFEYLKAAGIVTLFSIANSAMTETAAKYASNAAASGIAESNSELVNQLGGNMAGRAMNIQPTLTVENGTLINIMLNKNLYLPPAGGRPVTQKYILE